MNATISVALSFSDGAKPIAGSLGVTAGYQAQSEDRIDIPDETVADTIALNFGSIDEGATVLLINNENNQEMLLDINDNGVTHGLPPGALFGIVMPALPGGGVITEAYLTMKSNQDGDGSFSYLILGDP